MPIALGTAALSLIAWGCHRVISAQTRTSRIVARWLAGSQPLGGGARAFTLRARHDAPPLTLVGMRQPRVLVSESTLELLAADELEVALRHELAHIRSYDNLRKLVFRFCPFPGMAPLDAAWSQAAELAADDAAILNVNDALNLAAALVKLSRLLPVVPAPACTVGFVAGSLNDRVNRLLAWDESRRPRRMHIPRWAALPPVLLAMFCAFVNYGPLLSMTHQVTEWLVR